MIIVTKVRVKMLIQILNISLILANLFFMILSFVPLKHSMKAKYKLRHKLSALSLIVIFACNSYYLINANY